MTEQEARRILDEHRSECPRFVRGRYLYAVRKDGSVNVFRLRGKNGHSAIFESTVAPDSYVLHPDVRKRLAS